MWQQVSRTQQMRGAPIVRQRQQRQAGYESVPLKAHEDTYIHDTEALTSTAPSAPVEGQPASQQVQVTPAGSCGCSCSYGPPGWFFVERVLFVFSCVF